MVLHWYDLTCPFCYLAQARNDALVAHGAELTEIGFQAHPDVPPQGINVGRRQGAMYDTIARDAAEIGLPLRWQDKLPNSRLALAAVSWVETSAPARAAPFRRSLFHAHFAGGRDIGDRDVVLGLAAESGADPSVVAAGWDDGRAFSILDAGQQQGREAGVTGTPAWMIAGRLVTGLVEQDTLLAMLAINAATRV